MSSFRIDLLQLLEAAVINDEGFKNAALVLTSAHDRIRIGRQAQLIQFTYNMRQQLRLGICVSPVHSGVKTVTVSSEGKVWRVKENGLFPPKLRHSDRKSVISPP